MNRWFKIIGPGLAVAATGVGAGDMIAAAVAGTKYTIAVVWIIFAGAILKYSLNEGIARWQFATGTTMIEGWMKHLPKSVSVYFLIYLVLWSFIVGGALMSSCGVAANSLFPQLPVYAWAIIHSILGIFLVIVGKYKLFENAVKIFIAIMFFTLIICAILVIPELDFSVFKIGSEYLPTGSAKILIGVLGGVGGSVTLLSYGYWLRESKLTTKKDYRDSKIDLFIAYAFTGIFGVAVLIIAASVVTDGSTGSKLILEIATKLEDKIGETGKYIFLIGFWGAVASSLLGVWQGVPYLFSDFMKTWKQNQENEKSTKNLYNKNYYLYLLYIGIIPMLLLFFDRPIWIIIIYSIVGAFFMPFLAVVLLILNNKTEFVGEYKNTKVINFLLIVCLLLFGYLCVNEIIDAL